MGSINKRPLKAYVRFDGSGRVVPGSLILRKNMPKVGKWIEIPAYECCNELTTTTTTTVCPIIVGLKIDSPFGPSMEVTEVLINDIPVVFSSGALPVGPTDSPIIYGTTTESGNVEVKIVGNVPTEVDIYVTGCEGVGTAQLSQTPGFQTITLPGLVPIDCTCSSGTEGTNLYILVTNP